MHDKVFAHNFHLLHGNVFVLCSTFLNSAVLFYPFSYNMSVLMLYQFIFYYSSVNKLYISGTMTYRRFLCIGRYFCSLLIFNLKGILLYDRKKGFLTAFATSRWHSLQVLRVLWPPSENCRRASLDFFPPCNFTRRSWLSATWKRALTWQNWPAPLSQASQTAELW